MPEMTPGTALRELQHAQAGLKKARELLKQARENPRIWPKVFVAGWDSLSQAHRVIAAIPAVAAHDAVLTKQLAVERYATALLVRLRRLQRNQGMQGAPDVDDDRFGDEDGED